MADQRAFFKVDVGYFSNPKVAPLLDDNPRAVLLHLECIAYSAMHLTDGTVPVRLAMRTVCASVSDRDAMCNAGLAELVDERTVVVHDYLEHQRSAADVKRYSEAGRAGAAARWSEPHSEPHSGSHAVRNGREREEREEREEKHASHAPRSRRGASRTIPDDWRPTDAHRTYAEERGLDLSTEAFRFRNHAIANDRRAVRWDAAFSNWLTKAKPSTTSGVDKRPEGWR